MDGWKELFRPHILQRGLNYYDMGSVSDLRKTESGYTAVVEGTEDYEVEIIIEDHRIYDMECTCPYAENGNYCKHMAAVMFQVEQGDYEQYQPEADTSQTDSRKEIADAISKMSDEEIRELLEDIALEDEGIRNRILISVYPPNPSQIIRLKQEIDNITYRYAGRGGFIGYADALHYIYAMEAVLYDKVQTLIDRQHYMEAFEITNYIFREIGNQDMDDSDGGTALGANACYKFWMQILSKCGEADKKEMFQWFQEHQKGYVIDYMEDYISEFLMDEFNDADMLIKKLQILDEQIARAGDNTDCGSLWSVQHGHENNILQRLEIMKKLNYSEKDIQDYKEKHRSFSAIRKLEIEEFLKENKIEKAIQVLKESKELDNAYHGLISDYSSQLIELYKRLNQSHEYQEELMFQIFSCRQDNLDFVKQLKSISSEEEWGEYREKILSARTCQGIKYQLLEWEGMYEELLKKVTGSGYVFLMDQYEKLLKKKYPDQMRKAYEDYVNKVVVAVSDRKQYKNLIQYLKKISKYPEGKSVAAKIAEQWRVEYYRRPAMMDELKKAGF